MAGSRLLVTGFTLVVVCSLICVCTAENKKPVGQSPDLLQKITALETRIAALEKRVEQQSNPPVPVAGYPHEGSVYQASGIAPGTAPILPPGSERRTINGMPFYIVPLSSSKVKDVVK